MKQKVTKEKRRVKVAKKAEKIEQRNAQTYQEKRDNTRKNIDELIHGKKSK